MTMRTNYLTIALMAIFSGPLYGQDKYDEVLARIADGINASLGLAPVSTVLVSEFKRINDEGCNVGQLITMDFEAALLNKPHTYKLLDRANLEALAEEHTLAMKGMMDDEQRMREAGKILKADAIVFGTYRLVGNTLLVRVKAVDIQTTEQLAIVPATCAPSTTLKDLCSGQPSENVKPIGKTASGAESPSKKASPCEKSTGSYCFRNNGEIDLSITASFSTGSDQISVRPGKEECFYEKPAGPCSVELQEQAGSVWGHYSQTNIRIEPCQSGTYVYP